jgi:hypothetical protein
MHWSRIPKTGKDHYKKNSFQLIDPTLHTTIRSVAPVDWSRLRRDANYARVFKDAGDFGIGQSGMTIPVRGPFGEFGMLSVTRHVRKRNGRPCAARPCQNCNPSPPIFTTTSCAQTR